LDIDPGTLFQVGSISKTFLGAIVMRLVHEGRLRLDMPPGELLPWFEIDSRVTLRHLLTHSSGIPGDLLILNAPGLLAADKDDSLRRALEVLSGLPCSFPPGTQYSYNNAGMMIAAAMVEEVTGQPYVDTLHKAALGPAGMHRTFTQADEVVTYRVAAPHGLTPDGHLEVLRDRGWQRHWQLPGWDVPGGGIISSAAEMMNYGEYIYHGNLPAGMFEEQVRKGGPDDTVGITWMLHNRAGVLVATHSGLTIGYCSLFVVIPTKQVAFVVLTNAVHADVLNREVKRALLSRFCGPERVPDRMTRESTGSASDVAGTYDAGFYTVTIQPSQTEEALDLTARAAPPLAGQYLLPPPLADRAVPWTPEKLRVISPAIEEGNFIGIIRGSNRAVTHLRISERLARRVD
jgi:CubicO group peptidase (beta-lactamase class C family)